MRRLVAVAAVSIAWVLAACSSGGAEVAVEPADSAPVDTNPVDTNPVDTNPTADTGLLPEFDVEASSSAPRVLDPGDEPRTLLRHDWVVGPQVGQTTVSSQSFTQFFDDGGPQVVNVPAITIDAEAEVVAVDVDGVATIVQRGVGAEAAEPDPTTEALVEALGSMTVESRISPFGEVLDTDISVPTDVPGMDLEAMLASFGQATIALPSEPVGTGAEWEAVSTVEVLGVSVVQRVTYRVMTIEPGFVRLSFTTEQEPPTDDLQVPGLPEGATVEVVRWDVSGSGRIEIWLGQVSVDQQLDIDVEQTLRFRLDGEESTVVQFTNSNLDIRRRE